MFQLKHRRCQWNTHTKIVLLTSKLAFFYKFALKGTADEYRMKLDFLRLETLFLRDNAVLVLVKCDDSFWTNNRLYAECTHSAFFVETKRVGCFWPHRVKKDWPKIKLQKKNVIKAMTALDFEQQIFPSFFPSHLESRFWIGSRLSQKSFLHTWLMQIMLEMNINKSEIPPN